MNQEELAFSVVTPTYNRAHTLERLYFSLCRQNSDLFEWVIVDDGSSDNTSHLVEKLKLQSKFPIRYFYKENGGKHTAHNEALKLIRGELMLVIDSDDALKADALSIAFDLWNSIDRKKRNDYVGIAANVENTEGIVTEPFNSSYGTIFEGEFFKLLLSKKMNGEKLFIFRSDLMKENPFPVKAGPTIHVLEGIVWLRASKHKKLICLNQPLRIYYFDEKDKKNLSNTSAPATAAAWGKTLYCKEILNRMDSSNILYILYFFKMAINFNRYASHAKFSIKKRMELLESLRVMLLALVSLPVGYGIACYDNLRKN